MSDDMRADEKEVALNPWQPERDALKLAILGKLAEELGEASAIVSRCIIQGIDECEPVTKQSNRAALQNEIADVLAGVMTAITKLGLDHKTIVARQCRKQQHVNAWHALISPPASSEREKS